MGGVKTSGVNRNMAEPCPRSQVFTAPLESFHFNPLTRLVNIHLGCFGPGATCPARFKGVGVEEKLDLLVQLSRETLETLGDVGVLLSWSGSSVCIDIF